VPLLPFFFFFQNSLLQMRFEELLEMHPFFLLSDVFERKSSIVLLFFSSILSFRFFLQSEARSAESLAFRFF